MNVEIVFELYGNVSEPYKIARKELFCNIAYFCKTLSIFEPSNSFQYNSNVLFSVLKIKMISNSTYLQVPLMGLMLLVFLYNKDHKQYQNMVSNLQFLTLLVSSLTFSTDVLIKLILIQVTLVHNYNHDVQQLAPLTFYIHFNQRYWVRIKYK